jgi:hypothetical protein
MRYIISIYKVVSNEDSFTVFIGSTKGKLSLPDHKWIKSNTCKIKCIKKYPVESEEEEKQRELYWIEKYKKYGYKVIHNEIKIKEEKSKFHVCIENTSMQEILKTFGNRIVSISKEEKAIKYKPRVSTAKVSTPKVSKPDGNYIDELKKVLKNGKPSLKKPKVLPPKKKDIFENFVEELKARFNT